MIGWLARVRRALKPSLSTAPKAIAICHCHYLDMVEELANALNRLPCGCCLYVTSNDRRVLARWRTVWRRRDIPLHLHATENRGRDVRPFFEVLRLIPLEPNIPVLKVHGKKSLYTSHGERWRRDLLAGLLPENSTVAGVIHRFGEDPMLGMVGAPGSFISSLEYWGGNRIAVARIMKSLFGDEPAEEDLGFFAGTMFWVRGAVLLRMLPHIDSEAFEPEGGQQDATYAHALERAIGMTASRMGLKLTEIGEAAPLTPAIVRHRKVTYL